MIIWTPAGNATDVCAGIKAYNAARPPISPQARTTLVVLYALYIFLLFVSIVVMYQKRNLPLFRKVRPFPVTMIGLIALLFCVITYLLNPVSTALPCGLTLACLLIGMCYCAVNIFAKLLIFSFETQYAMMAQKYNLKIGREETDSQFSTSSASFSEVMYALFRVSYGHGSIEDLTMQQIALARNSLTPLLFCLTLPAAIPFIGIIAAMPQYQHCDGCGIFGEAALAYLSVCVIYLLGLHGVFHKASGLPDPMLIRYEVTLSLLIPGVGIFGGMILIIADPGDVAYNRVFAWEWLSGLGAFGYWLVVVVFPLYLSYIQTRGNQTRAAETSIGSMGASSANSPDIHRVDIAPEDKADFEAFLAERYALENLHFVEDASSYRDLYFSKGETWRLTKARLLYKTYIAPAALMEVNISHRIKNQIKQTMDAADDAHANNPNMLVGLDTLLDAAVRDIQINVLGDLVQKFNQQKYSGGARSAATPKKRIAPELSTKVAESTKF